jgi:hypothetical protein
LSGVKWSKETISTTALDLLALVHSAVGITGDPPVLLENNPMYRLWRQADKWDVIAALALRSVGGALVFSSTSSLSHAVPTEDRPDSLGR